MVMDAAAHDRLVAGVSHAAFLLSVGYVLALSGRPDWAEASKLAASGFRDMSRLAAGDPEIVQVNFAHGATSRLICLIIELYRFAH